jgi:hypothetical protein
VIGGPCNECGAVHPVFEFDVGDLVLVTEGKHAGARGEVVSWTQYGCPIRYEVRFPTGYVLNAAFPGLDKEGFSPCELAKG